MLRTLARTIILPLALLAMGVGCDGKKPEEQPPPAVSVAPPPKPPLAASAPPKEPKPEAPAEKLTVLFGGDVNLGRGAGQKILKNPKYDPFSEIAPLLATADFRAVNLESQLSDQNGETQSPNHHLVFTGPPGGAEVLAAAHIDLVSLANNHSWDYGKKALFETFTNLERAGVAYAGARREVNTAYEPTVLTIKGWRVAVFGVTHIWNQGPFDKHQGRFYVGWASFDNLQKRLRRAKKEYDLVLVSYHGGGEYVEVPMQWTRDFVRAVMSTGVDGIFGSHPHVPHGVGWFQTRPVFYSLGNLVFAMHSDYPWTGTSFMARVTYHRDGRIEAEACPYHILGHVPMPFEGKAKQAREIAFRSHLKLLSAATGGSAVGEPGELSCMPVMPKKRAGVDG